MLRLGVLDQSPVRSGGAVADAIHETLDLAEACDRLGYYRYWLPQHPATPGAAGPRPPGAVRPGAGPPPPVPPGPGGLLLPHYSPPQGAHSFFPVARPLPPRV